MYLVGYNKVMEIELYETASGQCPFDDWFESFRELHTRAKILTRLDRLKLGNFGDCIVELVENFTNRALDFV